MVGREGEGSKQGRDEMGSKKNRDFMSAFGTASDAFQKLAQDVYARGGDDEALRLIISDDWLRGRLADLIVGGRRPEAGNYTVTIDWSRSLEQMIAAGRYDYANEDINQKNFLLRPPASEDGSERSDCGGSHLTPGQVSGDGETELELVHLGPNLATEQVLAELDRRGLRPATLPELLAFGEAYPDVQWEFPVAAPGSSWTRPDGLRLVPCLGSYSGVRYLHLYWGAPDARWSDDCRFLAVRKSSSC